MKNKVEREKIGDVRLAGVVGRTFRSCHYVRLVCPEVYLFFK